MYNSSFDMPKSKIVNTDVSAFVWRIKDFGLSQNFALKDIKTKKIRVGNSDYFWYAVIVDGLEPTEKCMNLVILRDENAPNTYGKFSYDVNINYKNSRGEYNIQKMAQKLRDAEVFTITGKFIDNYLMEFEFELKVHEFDLSGFEVKSINSIDNQMKVLKDIEGLLESGLCSDMEIKVGGNEFKAHKAIMSRSPNIPVTLDFENNLYRMYLKFVYTGGFGGEMQKDELEKMKKFAEKLEFVALQNVCNAMLLGAP